ncbi:hypothetical protein [Leptospira stimsonii]|nr:hypothetical protein [Leptospira stimsonii]
MKITYYLILFLFSSSCKKFDSDIFVKNAFVVDEYLFSLSKGNISFAYGMYDKNVNSQLEYVDFFSKIRSVDKLVPAGYIYKEVYNKSKFSFSIGRTFESEYRIFYRGLNPKSKYLRTIVVYCSESRIRILSDNLEKLSDEWDLKNNIVKEIQKPHLIGNLNYFDNCLTIDLFKDAFLSPKNEELVEDAFIEKYIPGKIRKVSNYQIGNKYIEVLKSSVEAGIFIVIRTRIGEINKIYRIQPNELLNLNSYSFCE